MIEPWRWVEHAGWVTFEDLFLVWSCRRGIREMRDIAERQAALEILHGRSSDRSRPRTAELHESESLKASIIETAMDAIVTMDHGGRIVEFNPAAEEIFGYTKTRRWDNAWAELIIPPSQRQAHSTPS